MTLPPSVIDRARAELPDPNKLVAFERHRKIMVTMAENIEKATRAELRVERITAKDRTIDPASIEWTPPAPPFFGQVRGYGAPGRFQGRLANVLYQWR